MVGMHEWVGVGMVGMHEWVGVGMHDSKSSWLFDS